MARQYVKRNNSLTSVTTPSMKVYPNLDAVDAAIESGELKEGEVFGTEASDGIHTDITTLVYTMWSATPANASSENKFVVQSDLGDLNLTTLANRVTALEGNKVDCSDFTTTVTNLTSNIESRLTESCFNTVYSDIQSDLSDRVCCSDYTSDLGSLTNSIANKVNTSDFNSSVTNIQNDIAAVNTRIDNLDFSCFGGLTCSGWKDLIQCMIDACLGVLPTSPTGVDNQIYIG